MLDLVGWVGGVALSICALPQVIKTYRTKKIEDLSWGFILLWFGGEILTLAYIIGIDVRASLLHFPLYLNYGLNIILLFYLVFAKIAYGGIKA